VATAACLANALWLLLLMQLLAKLLSLLLGMKLLFVWMLVLSFLLLLSFLPPRFLSCVFAVLASKRWLGTYCPVHMREGLV
jgi:hypothetical protein